MSNLKEKRVILQDLIQKLSSSKPFESVELSEQVQKVMTDIKMQEKEKHSLRMDKYKVGGMAERQARAPKGVR